jgi:uncharacterized protein involved in exopolysaccharide biosynthesis
VSTIVESQIAIIKSEGVARAVIRKLGLAEDPELAGQNGVVRRMTRSISLLLGWSKPETESSVMRYALESFERKLSAKRVGLTYIVEITFGSIDPERAAQILNTVAETHITANMDAKYRSALRGEKWVKDRMNELSSQASAAQRAVADYHKNRSDVADPAHTVDKGTPPSQSTARMQGELRELEAAAESSAKTYDNFVRVLRYMDAMQQQSLPVFEARLLTEASRRRGCGRSFPATSARLQPNRSSTREAEFLENKRPGKLPAGAPHARCRSPLIRRFCYQHDPVSSGPGRRPTGLLRGRSISLRRP